MGKVWVLDTETKGTGAEMVPLEKVLRKPAPAPRPATRPAKPAARPRPAPEPRPPRTFKVTDAMTREVLAEGVDTRGAVELLGKARSIVDVSIHTWEPRLERWRPLTLREKELVWGFRDLRGSAGP